MHSSCFVFYIFKNSEKIIFLNLDFSYLWQMNLCWCSWCGRYQISISYAPRNTRIPFLIPSLFFILLVPAPPIPSWLLLPVLAPPQRAPHSTLGQPTLAPPTLLIAQLSLLPILLLPLIALQKFLKFDNFGKENFLHMQGN